MFKKLSLNIYKYQFYIAIVAIVLVIVVVVACVVTNIGKDTADTSSLISSENISSVDKVSNVVDTSSQNESSTLPVSSLPVSSAPVVSRPVDPLPVVIPEDSEKYNINSKLDIEDNVFLDSMVYTGYNLAKHRADGLMWVYVLSAQKPAKGWLTKISYDYDGGTSGYETNAQGLPDIAYFEKHDLVCASYVTYVYYNYMPNVLGIDTSSLPKPQNPTLANDWYKAAKEWVKKGYSYEIPFTASRSGGGEIQFKPSRPIPIGSILLCNDMKTKTDWACHVSIYAGYKNGYHWVYHVGNDNGPEFCAIERFCYGPDPVWPLSVISTPTHINFSANIEIKLTNDKKAPMAGVEFTLVDAAGKVVNLGKTNENGTLWVDGLKYGDYTLTYTAPAGYTGSTQSVKLTTANNSSKKVDVVCTAVK